MRNDTREELERLERELLAEDETADLLSDLPESLRAEVQGDPADDILLESISDSEPGAHPAFDDPDKIHEPKEPMVYCNYSNDYGRNLKEFAENGGADMAKKKKEDKLLIGLMATASFLCVAIVGVLIYWMEVFLS
ncbi:MAG: hypothetical protein LUJ09_08915 [Firmicutes bacterium]|nr:hypothetical protein [Bacillota bacterium]